METHIREYEMSKRSHSLGAGGGGKGLDVTMRQLNNIFILAMYIHILHMGCWEQTFRPAAPLEAQVPHSGWPQKLLLSSNESY